MASDNEVLKRGEKLSVLAYRKIQQMILDGELAPGERLNEHRFAVKHGLSRGPVREACRALERDGLVVSIQGKGVFVRELTMTELYEVYDLRALLTGFMCQLASQKSEDSHVKKLQELNQEMDIAAKRNDLEAYYEANLEFHDLISKIAGNGTLRRVYNGLAKETHTHRLQVVNPEITIKEHEKIIQAIREKDAEKAKFYGEEHVLSGKHRWELRQSTQQENKEKENHEDH